STGDNVIFDALGAGNCAIDASVNVSSITISTSVSGGYLGFVDTSSNTLTASTFTLTSGTFYARTSTITINSNLILSSGTFNANSSSITVNGSVLESTTVFNLGGSTISLSGDWNIDSSAALITRGT